MARSLISRLEALERLPPRGVTLLLNHGTKYRHPGPPLKTYVYILRKMNEDDGRVLNVIRKTVGASNFGLLCQKLRSLLPPETLQRAPADLSQKRSIETGNETLP